jgi:hypothetical protein
MKIMMKKSIEWNIERRKGRRVVVEMKTQRSNFFYDRRRRRH